jgi:hypothetical protein
MCFVAADAPVDATVMTPEMASAPVAAMTPIPLTPNFIDSPLGTKRRLPAGKPSIEGDRIEAQG